MLCVSALWWLPLVTEPSIGHVTAKFLLLVIPDLAAQCIWRPMNRVLASQRITSPFMFVPLGILKTFFLETFSRGKVSASLGEAV